MSEERTRLIEDTLRLDTILRLLKDVDCDSITEVMSVADRREAAERLYTIRRELKFAALTAHRKQRRLKP